VKKTFSKWGSTLTPPCVLRNKKRRLEAKGGLLIESHKMIRVDEPTLVIVQVPRGMLQFHRVRISTMFDPQTNIPSLRFYEDAFEYFVKTLNESYKFRNRLLILLGKWIKSGTYPCMLFVDNGFICLFITLVYFPNLDYMGSALSNTYVSVRCEMETALSWLSTLGGAFSALGDVSSSWAEEAGQISLKQLKIALKLGDPLIESRCRLYMAISLIQRGRIKDARRMVEREYKYACALPANMDPRLKKMCLGVWAKLQYSWRSQRSNSCNYLK